MDGGIIDYGSVRQFGMFHQEYRYDDVSRYSTSITEQKNKAKYVVQTFAQIVDYLKTGQKKPIEQFASSKQLKQFEKKFEYQKNYNLLVKIGFKIEDIDFILDKNYNAIEKFRESFSYFERIKAQKGMYKVSDGITHDAIFCMRDILRELPQILLSRKSQINHQEFIAIIKSSYAEQVDLHLSNYRKNKIDDYQNQYIKLIMKICEFRKVKYEAVLLEIVMRSSIINKYDRVTGDAVTTIVHKIMKMRPKLSPVDMFELLKEFRDYQTFDPDKKKKISGQPKSNKKNLKKIIKIVRDYREGL